MKRPASVLNGFLDHAGVKREADKLAISLVHGGREILEQAGFCRALSMLIQEQYGLQLLVELSGEDAAPAAQHEELIGLRLWQMHSPAPWISDRPDSGTCGAEPSQGGHGVAASAL